MKDLRFWPWDKLATYKSDNFDSRVSGCELVGLGVWRVAEQDIHSFETVALLREPPFWVDFNHGKPKGNKQPKSLGRESDLETNPEQHLRATCGGLRTKSILRQKHNQKSKKSETSMWIVCRTSET